MTDHRYRIAPFVWAKLTFEGDTLVFRAGVRRIVIPLARVQAFGVRPRPAFFGLGQSQLVIRHAFDGSGGRATRQELVFDPSSQACREVLAELRARLPDADTTSLPWPEAATRLGVAAHPWREGLMDPRSILGTFLVGAAAFTLAQGGPDHDAVEGLRFSRPHELTERITLWSLVGVMVLAGVLLLVSGFRRTRARRGAGASASPARSAGAPGGGLAGGDPAPSCPAPAQLEAQHREG